METFLFVKIIHLFKHVSAIRIFVRMIILRHLEVSFADLRLVVVTGRKTWKQFKILV